MPAGWGGRRNEVIKVTIELDDKPSATTGAGTDFIRAIIAEDLRTGKHRRVATRFPPEPNGYLHIGHAKSICLNFGVARENGGTCNLRFDDTNPETEDMAYVEAIQRDVRWLGFEWDALYFASDYFERLYRFAIELIEKGKAYVDSLSEEEIRAYRGTIAEPGRPSPYRQRSVGENLALFRRMRAGELPDGSHVLRAKIDMASPNMLMRDPILYRIRHARHYRTGDAWPIYPMYDFAHCLSDAIEGITHSLCTLEFENNREIYDWLIEQLDTPSTPRQIEFARLNLSYTVMSKRKLLQLVEEGHVAGWDDPRMPTLSGLRRRGVTPAAIRNFCDRVGVAKRDNVIDVALFEHAIRDDLNHKAPRVLGVLRPLKLVVESYPEGESEELDAPYWPHDVPREGSRKLPFSRVLYVERDDFAEQPPPGWHRLAPGREVRLRYAYLVTVTGLVKDDAGEVIEVRCRHDPASRGGQAPDGRKVKGTIHWLSAAHALPLEARLYDRLFRSETPGADGGDFRRDLNPDSLEVLGDSLIEPSVAGAAPGSHFQLERLGYFAVDPDSSAERLVLNRTVTLRDAWAKVAQREADERAAAAAAKAAAKAAHKARQRAKAGPAAASVERPLAPEQEAVAARYRERLGLAPAEARLLAEDEGRQAFFDAALAACGRPRAVAKWIANELQRELKERPVSALPFDGAAFGELVALVEAGTITAVAAKEVLAEMLATGGRPRAIVEARGLQQVDDDGALRPLIEQALAAHPQQVAAYRAGKEALFGFFVGQVMRASAGKANPQRVRELLHAALDGEPA
ncbi:MAG: glutamine--tRNA ligase/YqeY domain fusion protein [Acidobacteria bacterium]|nr:MAG: glutamine--tRNA ligase/YqeY domain fusion protein [Acidobacteriota bacterium]